LTRKEKEADREIKILSMLNHPNVIKIYEYFKSNNYISIIFEKIDGKPIFEFWRENTELFTIKYILGIILQLSKAIRHLKTKDVIWCNFSHDNIIFNGTTVVICGFSISRIKVSRKLNIDEKILGLKGNYFVIHFILNFFIIKLILKGILCMLHLK
jgi:serine/threonine protein kinase